MKKIILGLLMIFSITLFGCDSANLDVGVREDGTIFSMILQSLLIFI